MHGSTGAATTGSSRTSSHGHLNRPPFECIALLLQGGGALGSYQAGVYEALAEADLHPDWVAGISIGAINSAILPEILRPNGFQNSAPSGTRSPPIHCSTGYRP
jgi:NTE family protein